MDTSAVCQFLTSRWCAKYGHGGGLRSILTGRFLRQGRVPIDKQALRVEDHRIPPVRGLVTVHNARGRLWRATDVNRWIRLNRLVYRVDKLDILCYGALPDFLWALPSYARILVSDGMENSLCLDTSLRVNCAVPPPEASALKVYRFFDAFLCPASIDTPHLEAWIEACAGAGLPVRMQVQGPFPAGFEAGTVARRLADADVKSVNVALSDPFQPSAPCRDAGHSRETIDQMNALAAALVEQGVEANVIGLPLCLATNATRGHAENSQQFFLDHQQYDMRSYDLAAALYGRGSATAGKIVMMLLGRSTSFKNPLDELLLEWLFVKHPILYSWVALYRKLTRDIRFLGQAPEEDESAEDRAQRYTAKLQRAAAPKIGPVCGACSLRRICDHETETFKRRLPGVTVAAVSGDVCADPMCLLRNQPKYYDTIDAVRCRFDDHLRTMAKEANAWTAGQEPDRVVSVSHYGVEDVFYEPLSGAVRWHAVTMREQKSVSIGIIDSPFALSVTFGGGMARYIGFSFSDYIKVLCPMVAYLHRLTMYVDEAGRYVLLRDGEPVRPVNLRMPYRLPTRLPNYVEFSLSIWDMDESIATQEIQIWEEKKVAENRQARYSVVVVSTRFSRRLEAVLRCIAHQEGVDVRDIEVIVAYVPGIDGTDDVIDSMQLAYPDLRVLRSPFPAERVHAKGFMINQSLRQASGEWIFLIDSDILLPPNMFAEVDAVADSSVFVAPDGRIMLDAETTAKILVGEIEPWRCWDDLIKGHGPYRRREAEGLPIGYCQCLKASCLDKVSYEEYDHYEAADFDFAKEMREHFGRETRLDGLSVMHLDHGGSQWYGTQKHL